MMFKPRTRHSKKSVLKANEDYSNLIEVFAEEGFSSFHELSEAEGDELIAAWLVDSNRSEPDEIFYDFIKSKTLSEMMYGSIAPEEIGYKMLKILRTGKHIYRINEDLQSKYDELMSSRYGYISDTDLLIDDDNRERAVGCRRSL